MDQSIVLTLRTGRIICGALMAAVLTFWTVTLVMTNAGRNPLSPGFPLDAFTLTAGALVAALGAFAMALFFVSRAKAVVSTFDGREKPPPSTATLSHVQTNLIISWSLLEGVAFCIGVFFMMTGEPNLLLITAPVFILGFGLAFPRARWYGEAEQLAGVRL